MQKLFELALAQLPLTVVLGAVLTFVIRAYLKDGLAAFADRLEARYILGKESMMSALNVLENGYVSVKRALADAEVSDKEIEAAFKVYGLLKSKFKG